jgi:hypothetical protein
MVIFTSCGATDDAGLADTDGVPIAAGEPVVGVAIVDGVPDVPGVPDAADVEPAVDPLELEVADDAVVDLELPPQLATKSTAISSNGPTIHGCRRLNIPFIHHPFLKRTTAFCTPQRKSVSTEMT